MMQWHYLQEQFRRGNAMSDDEFRAERVGDAP